MVGRSGAEGKASIESQQRRGQSWHEAVAVKPGEGESRSGAEGKAGIGPQQHRGQSWHEVAQSRTCLTSGELISAACRRNITRSGSFDQLSDKMPGRRCKSESEQRVEE